jgi:hypothetical protein
MLDNFLYGTKRDFDFIFTDGEFYMRDNSSGTWKLINDFVWKIDQIVFHYIQISLTRASSRSSIFNLRRAFLMLNLFHRRRTFDLEAYCCQKLAFYHWSIVNFHEYPQQDLIASTRLRCLISYWVQCLFLVVVEKNSSIELLSCPSCSRKSMLLIHRVGNFIV